MKFRWALLLPMLCLAGCASRPAAEAPADFAPVPGPSQTTLTVPPPAEPVPPTNAPARKPPAARPLIVTPDPALTGKVVRLNEAARIVVLEFSMVNLPGANRQLFVYRDELKVGEVKTTRWQKEQHVVADLIAGEARVGDVVRDR